MDQAHKEEINNKLELYSQLVDQLVSYSESNYLSTKTKYIKEKLDELIPKLDLTLDECQNDNKIIRAKLQFLKGKALDLLQEYDRQAEECLSKAVKLNPMHLESWNILGHIMWKKKDYLGAQKCFECAIDQCGKNKESLRKFSVVLRCLGEKEERMQNVQKSVDLAKQAVALDVKDGESWYVLGNAYLSNFFVNQKKIDEIQNSIKAYLQSFKNITKPNPDLHFNKATAHKYLEDYEDAIKEFETSAQLDPELNSKQIIERMCEINKTIHFLIENKGRMKPKKLANLISSIPTALKSQPQHLDDQPLAIQELNSLQEGLNKNSILSGKITHIVTGINDTPAKFIFVDFKGEFGCISLYNTSQEVYGKINELTEVFVIQPRVKIITLSLKNINVQYKCLQIFDLETLFVDSKKLVDVYSPSIAVNQTFQK